MKDNQSPTHPKKLSLTFQENKITQIHQNFHQVQQIQKGKKRKTNKRLQTKIK